MKNLVIALSSLFIFGCASTPSEITNLGQDTYFITTGTNWTEKGIALSIEKGMKFCENLEKIFLKKELNTEAGRGYATLEFRCLDSDHPAIKRANK